MKGYALFCAGLLTLIGVLSVPQVAKAQEPEIAYACYVPDVGAVYRMMEEGLPEACYENDVPFSWIIGEDQPTGLPDTCGEHEIARYSVEGGDEWFCVPDNDHTHDPGDLITGALYDPSRVGNTWTVGVGLTSVMTLDCGEGKLAISGGWYIPGVPPYELRVTRSAPNHPSLSRYWYFHVRNDDTVPVDFTAHAVCVRVGGAS